MNSSFSTLLTIGLSFLISISTSATELFVSPSGNHVPPFSDWNSAATNIQDAIDLALEGDTVWVTNGVYRPDLTTNRTAGNTIFLNRPLTVKSVNGPSVTTVEGSLIQNKSRGCAYLTNGAVLSGFTLTGGQFGVSCESQAAVISNCIIACNGGRSVWTWAVTRGTLLKSLIISNLTGGAYGAALSNCKIIGNRSSSSGVVEFSDLANCIISDNYGVAAFGCNLTNCAVLSNTSERSGSPTIVAGLSLGTAVNCTIVGNRPGGVNQTKLWNCVAFHNRAVAKASHPGSVSPLRNCDENPNCSSPLYGLQPLLLSDGIHLAQNSPCIGAGQPGLAAGLDIDGEPWTNAASVGCDQWRPEPLIVTGPRIVPGIRPGEARLTVDAAGAKPYCWWTKDGIPLEERSNYEEPHSASVLIRNFGLENAGAYQVVISNAFGVVTSAVAQITVRCVDSNSEHPAFPYESWSTAAATIQDAVDAAPAGAVVLVTNGVYAAGMRASADGATNRVVLDQPVSLLSANGAEATIIEGAFDSATTYGTGSVRCVWIGRGAVLGGFTLRNGSTLLSGGGVFCTEPGLTDTMVACVVSNCGAKLDGGGLYGGRANHCTFVANSANRNGGGISDGVAVDCDLLRNNAYKGGATSLTYVERCRILTNSTGSGGALMGAHARSCTIAGNTPYGADSTALFSCRLVDNKGGARGAFLRGCAIIGSKMSGVEDCICINCTFTWNSRSASGATAATNCVFWFNQNPSGIDSMSTAAQASEDLFFLGTKTDVYPNSQDDGYHLFANSPCFGKGIALADGGLDIDGQPFANPRSIGCDEWSPELLAGDLRITPDKTPGAAKLVWTLQGAPTCCWWTKDGSPIEAGPHYGYPHLSALTILGFNVDDQGSYQAVASNAFGVVTSAVLQVTAACVDAGSLSPSAPYSSWATAAQTIQEAVDAAPEGAIVLVTNGVYNSGGRFVSGDMTNRLVLDKPITVMSLNGPAVTILEGARDSLSTNWPNSVRCLWADKAAMLGGFTLRNGASLINGGGVMSSDPAWRAVLIGCVITNCIAASEGGGAYGCTLRDCVISGNRAYSGGGTAAAKSITCDITQNSAAQSGGGAYKGMVASSLVHSNSAARWGGGLHAALVLGSAIFQNYATNCGGAYDGYLYNCTVVSNSFRGIDFGSIYDSIVYFNDPMAHPTLQDPWPNIGPCSHFRQVCVPSFVTPYQTASGITNNPQLLDCYHLAVTSPCRGAATNLVAGSFPDIDGEEWHTPASLGCDEVYEQTKTGSLSLELLTGSRVAAGGVINLSAAISGSATEVWWDFGDGPVTNLGATVSHVWTTPGEHAFTATVFNQDYPEGVHATGTVNVEPALDPRLESCNFYGSGAKMSFVAQPGLSYEFQSADSLLEPVQWKPMKTVVGTGQTVEVEDSGWLPRTRFYRLRRF